MQGAHVRGGGGPGGGGGAGAVAGVGGDGAGGVDDDLAVGPVDVFSVALRGRVRAEEGGRKHAAVFQGFHHRAPDTRNRQGTLRFTDGSRNE